MCFVHISTYISVILFICLHFVNKRVNYMVIYTVQCVYNENHNHHLLYQTVSRQKHCRTRTCIGVQNPLQLSARSGHTSMSDQSYSKNASWLPKVSYFSAFSAAPGASLPILLELLFSISHPSAKFVEIHPVFEQMRSKMSPILITINKCVSIQNSTWILLRSAAAYSTTFEHGQLSVLQRAQKYSSWVLNTDQPKNGDFAAKSGKIASWMSC